MGETSAVGAGDVGDATRIP